MRDRPTVHSQDNEIIASAVEYRRGLLNQADWYVTWITRDRPWEISVMRLPASDLVGRAWHHGKSVEYRVSWRVEKPTSPAPVAIPNSWGSALAS